MGLISDSLTMQKIAQEHVGTQGWRQQSPQKLPPAAAKILMTLLLQELVWAAEVTLRPAAVCCSTRCEGTLVWARACAKACKEAGGAYEFCDHLAVRFLDFCVRVKNPNALADSPLTDIGGITPKQNLLLLGCKLVLFTKERKSNKRLVNVWVFSPLFSQPDRGFLYLLVSGASLDWRLCQGLDLLSPFRLTALGWRDNAARRALSYSENPENCLGSTVLGNAFGTSTEWAFGGTFHRPDIFPVPFPWQGMG